MLLHDLYESDSNVIDFDPAVNGELEALHKAAERGPVDPQARRAFASYLQRHRQDLIRLYHGTAEDRDVVGRGLLPATKWSQSPVAPATYNSFVNLTYDPRRALVYARQFKKHSDRLVVYVVTLRIFMLKADLSPIDSSRMQNEEISYSVADSLIYTGNVRVKGVISPNQISVYGTYDRYGPK